MALLVASPSLATHHKTSHAHHETGKQYETGKHHGSSKHHEAAKHHDAHHKDSASKAKAPGGVTSVPAGGIKLYCGPGKSPLMVRKMTQGAGTTVTVLCR